MKEREHMKIRTTIDHIKKTLNAGDNKDIICGVLRKAKAELQHLNKSFEEISLKYISISQDEPKVKNAQDCMSSVWEDVQKQIMTSTSLFALIKQKRLPPTQKRMSVATISRILSSKNCDLKHSTGMFEDIPDSSPTSVAIFNHSTLQYKLHLC